MKFRGELEIELIVLQKVVRGLTVAVGVDQPARNP
jgi:hypothetical protein